MVVGRDRRAGRARRAGDAAGQQVGPLRREPHIGAERIVEPAGDVVARRPAAMDHLVVAAAAAEVARPAAATGLLAVDHALREPAALPLAIDPLADMAHGAGFVLDEAVACEQPAGGGNAEVAGARAARVGA